MKVKFIQHGCGHGLAYFAGAVADLDSKRAAELIALGVCAAESDEPPACELPADIPCRAELELNNIKSIDDLIAITDLTTLNGIGKGKAKVIAEYLAKK